MGHHFEDAADGVAGAKRDVHLLLHRGLRFGIDAVQQNFVLAAKRNERSQVTRLVPIRALPTAITWLSTSIPNSRRKSFAIAPAATRAVDSRAEARSRTYRASREVVLQRSGEVGMSGPGRGYALVFRGIAGLDR